MNAVAEIAVRRRNLADDEAIAALVARAFGRADEAALVEMLRRDEPTIHEWVADEAGRLVGHVCFSGVATWSGQPLSALCLAPLAVEPDAQGRGVGSALVRAALAELGKTGVDLVFVLGDPAYYARFGFAPARRFAHPFGDVGDAFMALALTPAGRAGEGPLRFARAFAAFS